MCLIQDSRKCLLHKRTKKARNDASLQDARENRILKEFRKKIRTRNQQGNEQEVLVEEKNHSPVYQKRISINCKIIPNSRNRSRSETVLNAERTCIKTRRATESGKKNELRTKRHVLHRSDQGERLLIKCLG